MGIIQSIRNAVVPDGDYVIELVPGSAVESFDRAGESIRFEIEIVDGDRRGVRIPNRALAAMRKGAQLRLQYRDGRPSWSLGGKSLSADVAAIVIASVLVAPADAALFPDLPGQCWRMK